MISHLCKYITYNSMELVKKWFRTRTQPDWAYEFPDQTGPDT